MSREARLHRVGIDPRLPETAVQAELTRRQHLRKSAAAGDPAAKAEVAQLGKEYLARLSAEPAGPSPRSKPST